MSACRTGAVRYLLAGQFRRLVWTEHGDPAAPVLVCVHGLTRNSRDFDVLAQALCDQWRVIAPDLPGRGGSDWLPDAALYQPASYVIALSHLLAHLDRPIDYLGTSLGGICGMAIASMPGQPIRRLVLNDIGPHVPAAALARIRSYISQDLPPFTDLSAAERYLRQVHAPFGRLTDSQWARLARHSVRPGPSGTLLLHYDPLIARQMSDAPPQDIDMWDQWNAIDCPILTMRGEASDLLTEPTLARMTARSATLTIPDAGHAPALMDAPSIDAIRNFLFA